MINRLSNTNFNEKSEGKRVDLVEDSIYCGNENADTETAKYMDR